MIKARVVGSGRLVRVVSVGCVGLGRAYNYIEIHFNRFMLGRLGYPTSGHDLS